MKVGFDGGIKLEFHGAKVTSNEGLLAYRDRDDALILTMNVNNCLDIVKIINNFVFLFYNYSQFKE